jgi:hypothetical protein
MARALSAARAVSYAQAMPPKRPSDRAASVKTSSAKTPSAENPSAESSPAGHSGATGQSGPFTAPGPPNLPEPPSAAERTESPASPSPDASSSFLRAVVGPAAGIGLLAALVAAHEGAAGWIAAVAGAVVTAVVVGMIALKRGLSGG